jgi:hypothetical protein
MSDWRIRWKGQTADGRVIEGEAALGGYFSLEAVGRHIIEKASAPFGSASKAGTTLTITITK